MKMKNNMFTKIYEQGEDGEDSEDTILFSGNREQEIAVIRQSLYSKLLTNHSNVVQKNQLFVPN